MSDLVERLREYERRLNQGLIQAPYLGEAADEIERLTAENKALRDAMVEIRDSTYRNAILLRLKADRALSAVSSHQEPESDE